jgi:hypothetical protein
MSSWVSLFCVVGAAFTSACAEPTGPVARAPRFSVELAVARVASAPSTDARCTFDSGTLRCVTVDETTVTRLRTVVSGCLAGPTGVPGRRETTFHDTFLVTTVTTSLRRGYAGIVYDTSTSTTETLISSVQLSSTCTPI